MADKVVLPAQILVHVSSELGLPVKGVVAVIELLDEGGTVPFIARYRKEATGNLDEVQIRAVEEQLGYYRELLERRATVLASIADRIKAQRKEIDVLKANEQRLATLIETLARAPRPAPNWWRAPRRSSRPP